MVIWKPSHDGLFSTWTTWDVVRNRGAPFEWNKWFWHTLLPKKISMCLWKTWFRSLAVDARIQTRGIPMVSTCDYPLQRSQETINHIFSLGEVALEVWRCASVVLGILFQRDISWKNRMASWFHYAQKSSIKGMLIRLISCLITWCLWQRRWKTRIKGRNQSADHLWRYLRY